MAWYDLGIQNARWNTWVLRGAFELPDGPPSDPWLPRRGRPTEATELRFQTYSEGPRVAVVPDVPLARAELGAALADLAGDQVQLVPVVIDGSRDPAYVALNVLARADCIDHSAMHRPRWPADHPGVPGEYKDGLGMTVFEDELAGYDIVRPVGHTRAVLVSERVRTLLEKHGGRRRGVDFRRVPASRT